MKSHLTYEKERMSLFLLLSLLLLSIPAACSRHLADEDPINTQIINEEEEETRHDEEEDPEEESEDAETADVDENLTDEISVNNQDTAELKPEEIIQLDDLGEEFEEESEPDSDGNEDEMEGYEDDMKQEAKDEQNMNNGLIDMDDVDSDKVKLVNFKKVSQDAHRSEEHVLGCLKRLGDYAWVLEELVLCVGNDFRKVKIWAEYEWKKLLARTDSVIRKKFMNDCYQNAGLNMRFSRSCDLMERDTLELLWAGANYAKLMAFNRKKYTQTHGELSVEFFNAICEYLDKLYTQDFDLIQEIVSHGEISVVRIKKYIDDRTEVIGHGQKMAGVHFHVTVIKQGKDQFNNWGHHGQMGHHGHGGHHGHHGHQSGGHNNGHRDHDHYHSKGVYDAGFKHPDDDKQNGYVDYDGDGTHKTSEYSENYFQKHPKFDVSGETNEHSHPHEEGEEGEDEVEESFETENEPENENETENEPETEPDTPTHSHPHTHEDTHKDNMTAETADTHVDHHNNTPEASTVLNESGEDKNALDTEADNILAEYMSKEKEPSIDTVEYNDKIKQEAGYVSEVLEDQDEDLTEEEEEEGTDNDEELVETDTLMPESDDLETVDESVGSEDEENLESNEDNTGDKLKNNKENEGEEEGTEPSQGEAQRRRRLHHYTRIQSRSKRYENARNRHRMAQSQMMRRDYGGKLAKTRRQPSHNAHERRRMPSSKYSQHSPSNLEHRQGTSKRKEPLWRQKRHPVFFKQGGQRGSRMGDSITHHNRRSELKQKRVAQEHMRTRKYNRNLRLKTGAVVKPEYKDDVVSSLKDPTDLSISGILDKYPQLSGGSGGMRAQRITL